MNKNLALAVVASIGVVVTAILAAHGGKDAQILKEKVDHQCSEVIPRKAKEMHWSDEVTSEILKDLRRREKRELIKIFAPTVITAGATILLITIQYKVSKGQISALGAFGAAEAKRLRKYRKAAKEVFGEDADEKIIAQVADDDMALYPSLPSDDDQNIKKKLFYDFYSQRFFYATTARVREAIYHLNRNFQLRWNVSVNEFYEFIGIDKIPFGDNLGWFTDWFFDQGYEGAWVDVHIKEDCRDGHDCLTLWFSDDPITQKEYEESCG